MFACQRSFQFLICGLAALAVGAGCASKPKKSDSDLADLLLNKSPSIGVPSPDDVVVAPVEKQIERPTEVAAPVYADTSDEDRRLDKERDETGYRAKFADFQQRFLELVKSENDLPANGDERRRELEKLSFSFDQLRADVAKYRECPGILFFYGEGAERNRILIKRSAELADLDSSWNSHLASVQEEISRARSVDAIKTLQRSVSEVAPAPLDVPEPTSRERFQKGNH